MKLSLEILPRHADEMLSFPKYAEEVFITCLPGSEYEKTLESSRKIIQAGYTPVPHLAVRSLGNIQQLETYLSVFAESEVTRLLIIGGGGEKQEGEFSSSLEVLETGVLAKYGISHIYVGGHPEGNPFDSNSEQTLVNKLDWGVKNGYEMTVVTQWSFSADVVNGWIKNLRVKGYKNPVYVGIPGPATLKTLFRFAALCGIENSWDVLKKQSKNISKLLFVQSPDDLIQQLEGYEKLHLYSFGGLKRLFDWLQKNDNFYV